MHDHRKLGRELGLFDTDPLIGSGLPYWLPAGAAVRFCSPDQAADEARAALAMIRQAYAALGIEPARYRLSLRGPDGKYVGDPGIWDQAAAMRPRPGSIPAGTSASSPPAA